MFISFFFIKKAYGGHSYAYITANGVFTYGNIPG